MPPSEHAVKHCVITLLNSPCLPCHHTVVLAQFHGVKHPVTMCSPSETLRIHTVKLSVFTLSPLRVDSVVLAQFLGVKHPVTLCSPSEKLSVFTPVTTMC